MHTGLPYGSLVCGSTETLFKYHTHVHKSGLAYKLHTSYAATHSHFFHASTVALPSTFLSSAFPTPAAALPSAYEINPNEQERRRKPAPLHDKQPLAGTRRSAGESPPSQDDHGRKTERRGPKNNRSVTPMESAARFGQAQVTFELLKKGLRGRSVHFKNEPWWGGQVSHNRHMRVKISNNYPTSAGGDSCLWDVLK